MDFSSRIRHGNWPRDIFLKCSLLFNRVDNYHQSSVPLLASKDWVQYPDCEGDLVDITNVGSTISRESIARAIQNTNSVPPTPIGLSTSSSSLSRNQTAQTESEIQQARATALASFNLSPIQPKPNKTRVIILRPRRSSNHSPKAKPKDGH